MEDNLVSPFACRLAFHLERFHDLRLVWPPRLSRAAAVVGHTGELVHRAAGILFCGPGQSLGQLSFSGAELKAMQEVITLSVFAIFSVLYLGQPLTLNHVLGFGLIALGAAFVFNGPF
jgi:hypothetical protein